MKKTLKIRLQKILVGIMFVFMFCALFVLSAMSGLRFFIPHYFNVVGTPFIEKNYVVIFQDNNDLRPTGGNIAGYGILNFKNGFFAGIDRSNALSKLDASELSNPDFVKTAEKISEIYELAENEVAPNGVFSIDIAVLEDLLEIVKKVNVAGISITRETAVEAIGSGEIELYALTSSLLTKAMLNPLVWRDTSDMIVKNLREKHIQIYFVNEQLQKAMEEKGWNGSWPKPEGDFLAIIESNLSETKSDRYIKRSVKYRLEIQESGENSYNLLGKVIIDLEHFGDFDDTISGILSGDFRIYLPHGTKLTKSNVGAKEINSDEFAIFETAVSLRPGQRQTLEYSIELPSEIFDGKHYHLDLIKQAGTDNDVYSIIIEVPGNFAVQSRYFDARENFAIFEGPLNRDRSLDFEIIETN